MKNPGRLWMYLLIFSILSCSKDDITEETEPFLVRGGTDKLNVGAFSVQLNASLAENQKGLWSIVSGLVDNKVGFYDEKKPNTVFYGLPGITYELEWYVTDNGKISRDTITISFVPLKTNIIDRSLDFYTTRRLLEAKKYDRGIWRIEGDEYDRIWDRNGGGTVIPDEESDYIKFFGFENKKYKLIWETWYGSVSATDTLIFETSEYHQYEALENLFILNKEYNYELDEAGNVVRLYLGGDINGTVFDQFESNQSLKALVHLKWLNLAGNNLRNPPSVISTYYLDLEYLKLNGNYFTSLPENFGNLKKLDTLLLDYVQGGYALSTLPESFGDLESLRYLNMASTGITKLPESFSKLSNLEYLDLSVNIMQKLPEKFGDLKKLKTFIGPALHNNIPESFTRLENLTLCSFLILHNTPKIPENFGDLANLENLWIYADLHSIPKSITNLTKLKDLELSGAQELLLDLPEDIGNLNNLETLRLHGNFSSLPSSIGNLHKLRYFHISGSLGYVTPNISKLASIEYLNLDIKNMTEIPPDIGNLKKLTHLFLGNNKIKVVPESIGSLTQLYKFDLSNNDIHTLPQTITRLNGNLKELYIRGNNISESHVLELNSWLPSTSIFQ